MKTLKKVALALTLTLMTPTITNTIETRHVLGVLETAVGMLLLNRAMRKSKPLSGILGMLLISNGVYETVRTTNK